MATELLVGPIYFRTLFGGTLTPDYGDKVVDALLSSRATERDLTTGALQPQIAEGGP